MLMDSAGAIWVRSGGMTSHVFFTLLAASLWYPSHWRWILSTSSLIFAQKNLPRYVFFIIFVLRWVLWSSFRMHSLACFGIRMLFPFFTISFLLYRVCSPRCGRFPFEFLSSGPPPVGLLVLLFQCVQSSVGSLGLLFRLLPVLPVLGGVSLAV